MRGTQHRLVPRRYDKRFIPARAGNTHKRGLSFPYKPVHPRACGEHGVPELRLGGTSGSSPRVRGTHYNPPFHVVLPRFIPARAGNTKGRPYLEQAPTVHPRACGEHSVNAIGVQYEDGSSPRVRGTLMALICHALARRFIPARAGNTWLRWLLRPIRSVHPRACGEHYRSLARANFRVGSSPRVRGTLPLSGPRQLSRRFIPARAGNTYLGFYPANRPAVHPRACGEHSFAVCLPVLAPGSSPRVRGTRAGALGQVRSHRFIPARAGNTKWR